MYTELDQLYNMDIIRTNFNQEKLLQELLTSNLIDSKTIKIPKGRHFDTVTDTQEHIYYLERGIAHLSYENKSLAVLIDQQFIGLGTVLDFKEKTFDIQAYTECELLMFDRKQVMELLFSMQEGMLYLYLYEKDLQQSLLEKIDLLYQKGSVRLIKTFQTLCHSCGHISKDGNWISIPRCFTIKRIADMTNLSPRSVSDFSEELIAKKIIIKEAGQFIIHIERLDTLNNKNNIL
ncbi:Crp/Fnr family transcriptional regulator [Listeria booriae]|uniref:Crp/Fnr family transcriptional regulator n=1 Tax=Listeria booriae TaxID=1552123 RepID=UPI001628964A|nr:Crp/Fnr family transcriptional regulator [Listeria booriae]MBC2161871.1 Crp/Fnr family transcriptional regulator [Listeria booriae]